jgi:hypothetical protein
MTMKKIEVIVGMEKWRLKRPISFVEIVKRNPCMDLTISAVKRIPKSILKMEINPFSEYKDVAEERFSRLMRFLYFRLGSLGSEICWFMEDHDFIEYKELTSEEEKRAKINAKRRRQRKMNKKNK